MEDDSFDHDSELDSSLENSGGFADRATPGTLIYRTLSRITSSLHKEFITAGLWNVQVLAVKETAYYVKGNLTHIGNLKPGSNEIHQQIPHSPMLK